MLLSDPYSNKRHTSGPQPQTGKVNRLSPGLSMSVIVPIEVRDYDIDERVIE